MNLCSSRNMIQNIHKTEITKFLETLPYRNETNKFLILLNDRDFESIINMNADSTKQFGSFKIYAPNGTVLNGTDEQIDFLKGWFENENPKWNTYFSYTNRVEGQPGEWVITGSQVKRNIGGDEVVTWDIADVYIEDGKIGAFWVWTRADAVQD